ncbi:MAG TPA: hypothetical protein DCR93_35140 [Cytophagales bacterium]|nr:hypothetical protein [Cytophagales bacterium]HAP64502.1 hypothetical protein [Cytophagales bacterium]
MENPESPGLCLDGNCDYYYWEGVEMGVQYEWDEYEMDSIAFYHTFSTGSNRVFAFEKKHHDNPAIADDELTEYFRFQVPMSSDDFIIETTEEMTEAQAAFVQSCYCFGPLVYAAQGRIEGERISQNVFKVTVDVTYEIYEEVRTVNFSRRMRIQDTPDWIN